jgi:tetratricopeptide (TPR) repeat protein
VGLNFDRSWESTMSDVMYDPTICRNIMVDIRYVLFIIDKFAGAGHLVEEMTLVTKEYREQQKRKTLMNQVSGLTQSLGNAKEPSKILTERGKLYYDAGMYPEARADFEAILRSDKDNAEVLVWKGKAEIGAGHCPDAVKSLTRAVQLNSKIFDAHFYKGIALYEKGDYNEAIKAFGEAIALQPDSFKAYYNRGVCKHLIGRQVDGCADLDMAQKLGGNKEEWIFQTVCK